MKTTFTTSPTLTVPLEALVIILAKNYMAYLVVMVAVVVLQNLVVSAVANKKYPFLKEKPAEKLSKAEISEIFKNVRALAIYKVSGAFQKGVDSIIISSIFGTAYVGFLSYYKMIVLSVGLAYVWGIPGVLFATVAARLSTHAWYDPWLIYRKVFHQPFSSYIKKSFSVTPSFFCRFFQISCDGYQIYAKM